MQWAAQGVWAVGLLGALFGTLGVLKAVALVLRALRDILRLAELTREAARGIERNLAAASRLSGLEPPAAQLRQGVVGLAAAVPAVEQKVDGLIARVGREGS